VFYFTYNHRMITIYACMPDGQTDNHHDNSATIGSNERIAR